MGTRSLVMVVLDGETKVAQWVDGYPNGQGASIYAFLTHPELKPQAFIEAVRQCYWITDSELEMVNEDPNWPEHYPWLTRDAGAAVLSMIYSGQVTTGLQDRSEFGYDGLMCEYAYVIDLSGDPTLEFYTGFHPVSEPVRGRWKVRNRASHLGASSPADHGYGPISMVWECALEDLPKTRTEFVEALDKAEGRGE